MRYIVLFILAAICNPCYAKHNYLQDAHKAYSKGKFLKLSKSIKRVFETNHQNSPKVDNAQCLLSQVFQFLQESPLPVEFKLPRWLYNIHLKSSVTENDSQIRNYIEVKGIIDNDVKFQRLEIIQYPSKRILDSKDRNSTFKIVAINQNQSQFTYKKILNNSLKNG
ncbi:hypothetical protein MJH12_15860, partial [bacterium]|nr:hypothetical protein [bacterium]